MDMIRAIEGWTSFSIFISCSHWIGKTLYSIRCTVYLIAFTVHDSLPVVFITEKTPTLLSPRTSM